MIKLDIALDAFKNKDSLEMTCAVLEKSYKYHGLDDYLSPNSISEILTDLSKSNNEEELLKKAINWHKTIESNGIEKSQFKLKYKYYKSVIKPQNEIKILSPLIAGETILDFGSGEGYIMDYLTEIGLDATGQEVCKYEGNEKITYKKIGDDVYRCGNLRNHTFDTTLIKSTMHHIQVDKQLDVLTNLSSKTKDRLILWEEVYGNGNDTQSTIHKSFDRPTEFQIFTSLDYKSQKDFLVMMDFVGNVLIGEFVTMDMPFSFLQKNKWVEYMASIGFDITHEVALPFPQYMVHRSNHLIMIFDRK